MDKSKELYGLSKIPDEIIIKNLLVELGKCNSNIKELEDEIRLLKSSSKEDIEEKRKIRKEQIFDEYRKQIKSLNDSVRKLRKDNELLIIRLHKNV
jgi:hypothetical protein